MNNHYAQNSFVLRVGGFVMLGGLVCWLDGDGPGGAIGALLGIMAMGWLISPTRRR